ncbi:MAG: pyrroline-5-carboxylate reductase [Alphaproteobacteria bacterium]|nr:pyrroline-5-carboxylate reductase [Alphaproteobacteria bacterium]
MVIVGCGNMGGAMLAGWLAGGLDPASVTVVDPVLASVPEGVTLLRDAGEAASGEALLLGVKPQMLDELAPGLAHLAGGAATVLSILAGVELATLVRLFPDAAGHVRIMPNLAAAIGKSPVALAASGLGEDVRTQVAHLMEPLGTPLWIGESLFDAVTALTGSGPAFVYRFIDALAGAATDLGLEAGQACVLALAMTEGAALLAASSLHAPGELADRVASPGGTTRAGLDVLDRDGALARLVAATLQAAADRSAEMAGVSAG